MAETGCRNFTGYKPCAKNIECDRTKCASYESIHDRILIVHLEALGAVLRSTSLIAGIRRKYPRSHITWITKAPAQNLLAGVPGIDRVLTLAQEDILTLAALEFDLAFVIDKSLVAAGVLAHTKVAEVRGFRADARTGAIVQANLEARALWELGLSDHEKFFVNQKSEQQLVHEALALDKYQRDEYVVTLSATERDLAARRRQTWSAGAESATERLPIIGINTGCSPTLTAKKLTVEGHRQLITKILADPRLQSCPIVLLGGPEDTERNQHIAKDLPVTVSPTTKGLRDGLASVAACDLVFSGDSLGMHMAIGLQKWVVAWFGPTCQQEIDLYGRGVKILTQAPCSPCWKRDCQKPVMCYDQVDFDQTVSALVQGKTWLTSSSKPHIPETYSSPSP